MQRPKSAPTGSPPPKLLTVDERKQLAVAALNRIVEQATTLRTTLEQETSTPAEVLTERLLALVKTTQEIRGHVECAVTAASQTDPRDKWGDE